MKEAELNRILTSTKPHPAPHSPLSLHARQISHRSPPNPKSLRLPLIMGSDPIIVPAEAFLPRGCHLKLSDLT
jgi:hypothetical protein